VIAVLGNLLLALLGTAITYMGLRKQIDGLVNHGLFLPFKLPYVAIVRLSYRDIEQRFSIN